jgi:hypothetical protein
MAIAALGDTVAVARMADSVEFWGQRSIFGRDPRSHHYVRGLMNVARGRDDDAIRELEQAMYSPSMGKQVWTAFTNSYDAADFRRNLPDYTLKLVNVMAKDRMIAARPS